MLGTGLVELSLGLPFSGVPFVVGREDAARRQRLLRESEIGNDERSAGVEKMVLSDTETPGGSKLSPMYHSSNWGVQPG